MFYILYSFVAYLLTLLRMIILNDFDDLQNFKQYKCGNVSQSAYKLGTVSNVIFSRELQIPVLK
jgi:hypothetical protein